MPPVFQSVLFPSGTCGQVRPFGATLPTAARRATSFREAADGYTCPQVPDGIPTGKHGIPGLQNSATGTGRSDTRVDIWRGHVQTWTLMEGATLATSSNRRKPERLELRSRAHLQTRKRVSGRSLV